MPEEVRFQKKDFAAIGETLSDDVRQGVGKRPKLTDRYEGSVVLTLLEAFARELAVAYEQLDFVYRCAFLETAKGTALDQVVALLGLKRLPPHDYLVGSVQFSRATPADADIAIPAGTMVAGLEPPMVQTVQDARLEAGRTSVTVDVQSVEPQSKPIPPGNFTLMQRPIFGVEVTNPGPIIMRQTGESDDELRARARQTIRGATTGTVDALVRAVRSCGVPQVKVIEDFAAQPGEVRLVLGDMDKLNDTVMARVEAAVARARPAGVRVMVGKASEISIRIAATLQLNKDFTTAERQAIEQQVRKDLKAYFKTLDVGDAVREVKLRAVLGSDPRIGAVTETTGMRLMEPFNGTGANAVSLANKLMTTGDFMPDQAEKAVLAADGGWPKLTLESPGVRVNALLTLKRSLSPSAVRPDFVDRLTQLLTAKAQEFELTESRAAQTGDKPRMELTFKELRDCLAVPDTSVVAMCFDIVHERTGRVLEMTLANEAEAQPQREPQRKPQRDTFDARERPRMGDVTVKVGDG